MALLNTGCLISTIQADVTGVTTGYAAECFAIIAAGVDSATANRCVVFPNSGCLPSLYPTQTIPEGQIVFLDDICVPLYAASGEWLAFDKRSYRRDRPLLYDCYLYTWGNNIAGQLGDGTTVSRSSPGTTAGCGVTWCKIASGGTCKSSAGIKTDGTLWTWGANDFGQLGTGNTTSRSSPGTVAGGGTTWCQVAIGNTTTTSGAIVAAIKTDGTLWTWGLNSCGALGDGTTTARCSPGTVAGGGTTWCQVAVNYGTMAAVKTDGTVWTWGYDGSYGKLGDGIQSQRCSPGTVAGGGTTWCQVSVGSLRNMAAVKTDGTLWTWGYDGFYGILGTGTQYSNKCSPVTTAGGGTTWCRVSVSCTHTVAIKTDGTIWTWGDNTSGGLGTGNTTARCSPGTLVGGGTTWCSIDSGFRTGAALKTDGTLWTWGYNTYGQLGDGSTTARSSPVSVVGGFTDWTSVALAKENATPNGATLAIRRCAY